VERQRRVLDDLAARVAASDLLDGLIVLGSVAAGTADAMSDVDALAVVRPGALDCAWEARLEVVGAALVTWEGRDRSGPLRWLKWLTPELVKVECGFLDAESGARALADPFLVAAGDGSIVARFPRTTPDDVHARRAVQAASQGRIVDPETLAAGERIDWSLSELKTAVRDAIEERG